MGGYVKDLTIFVPLYNWKNIWNLSAVAITLVLWSASKDPEFSLSLVRVSLTKAESFCQDDCLGASYLTIYFKAFKETFPLRRGLEHKGKRNNSSWLCYFFYSTSVLKQLKVYRTPIGLFSGSIHAVLCSCICWHGYCLIYLFSMWGCTIRCFHTFKTVVKNLYQWGVRKCSYSLCLLLKSRIFLVLLFFLSLLFKSLLLYLSGILGQNPKFFICFALENTQLVLPKRTLQLALEMMLKALDR